MRDSLPLKLVRPEMKYAISSEPEERVSINQHSNDAYIKTVKKILTEKESNKI